MSDPCDDCQNGTMFCNNECDYYHVKWLYATYPHEMEKLLKITKNKAQKMVSEREVDVDEDIDEEAENDEG
jgi:hypothetical protein